MISVYPSISDIEEMTANVPFRVVIISEFVLASDEAIETNQ
jgi:hypothetical protein